MKLIKTIITIIKAIITNFITAQRNKLRISPITQRHCDKKLLAAANRTAIYGLAKKATEIFNVGHNPIDDPIERAYRQIEPQHIGGEATFMNTPAGFGYLFPWPDPFVRYIAECHARNIEANLDSAIVQQIADKSLAADRVFFKKCMTRDVLEKALLPINGEAFSDCDGLYYICVTSTDRIRKSELFKIDGGDFETSEEYQDYIDRPLYVGEYGRYKLDDGFYIVFLTTLDDRMMHSLLFGPDAITMIPLENNLKAIFRFTPAGEAGRQPRGYDVGYYMKLGAEIDKNRCVVLEAAKRLE